MYGVETCVHPEHQSRGIGSRLMNARFDLVRRLKLRGIIAGSLFMDYHKVADQITPQQYVREVVRGLRYDSNLTKQLHKGFRVLNLIPNYTTDPRTLNWAAAIVWDNPDWHAPKAHGRIIPARFDVPRPAPQVRAGRGARGI
jgi:ribosomal protein S18 acetylase RimI-like enzyme